MCTLSCRVSFLARVTAVSGLAWLSSTISFTLAPAKSLLVSSRYMLMPSTMSLPTWANGPVVGTMRPMRNSSAAAGGDAMPSAMQPPSISGNEILGMSLSSLGVVPVMSCGRRSRLFRHVLVCCGRAPLTNALRNAHQAGRKIENGQHIDRAQHVLPPGNQGAEIFAQTEYDER